VSAPVSEGRLAIRAPVLRSAPYRPVGAHGVALACRRRVLACSSCSRSRGGAAGGWFGHIQQAKAALKAADSFRLLFSSSGEVSGPCGAWQERFCSASGKQSSACQQAKGATDRSRLLRAKQALRPAGHAQQLKSARAGCEKLSPSCAPICRRARKPAPMVKERTPASRPQRCDEMMKHSRRSHRAAEADRSAGWHADGGPVVRRPWPGGPGGPGPVMSPPH